MKVVALHTDFRIYWPARLRALNDSLKRAGHEFCVIEIAGKGSPYSFSNDNLDKKDIDWRILFPDGSPENLDSNDVRNIVFTELDSLNPDIIIAGAIAFPSGANAVAWASKNNKRVICFDDTKEEINHRNLVVDFVKKAVYSGVDAIIYPAEQWIMTGEKWGFNNENCFFGVDVVDNSFWQVNTISYSDNLIKGSFFLAVGRHIPRKNYDTLLQAFAKTVDDCHIRLVMIGDGPEHEALVEKAYLLGLSNKVIFLSYKTQEELRWYFQNCRAFILPSHEETWGLVINEAMASGAPIIASKQCGAAEVLIEEGKNGFTFNHNDIEALSQIITKFNNMDNDSLTSMAENSKRIISNWDLDSFCNGCLKAIEYVSTHKKRKTSLIDKSIIALWKGRYRPK